MDLTSIGLTGEKARTRERKVHGLNRPRIRFNWGFHDGAGDHAKGTGRSMADHFDRVYAAGYVAGFQARADGLSCTSSQDAWEACEDAQEWTGAYDVLVAKHGLKK